MIKQIFKQIWIGRRQNIWILLELIGVSFFLFLMTDILWIRLKNYKEPKGFDIENTYILKLKILEPIAASYVQPEEITQTPAEDLFRIVDRIKLHPDVEHVAVSFHSLPYSRGGFWNSLRVDSTVTRPLRCRMVTPSYFDVFNIRTADNQPIRIDENGQNQLVLTKDIAGLLYENAIQATGKAVYIGDKQEEVDNPNRIAAVCNLFKWQEFEPYEGAYFDILSVPRIEEWGGKNSIAQAEICIRVRQGTALSFRDNFKSDMGDRLKENNLYVSSIISSAQLRNNVVGKNIRENILPMIYVLGFVLITVFLGVFGSFWLRTHQRRGEIGIRMAMGANRMVIRGHMLKESLLLMAMSMLPAFLVYLNMLYSEALDVWRLPVSAERIIIVLTGTVIIQTIVITGGTLWPANRAASTQLTDALRDE